MSFYLYGIAALIAGTLKTLILFNVKSNSKYAKEFVLLAVLFICQNASEFLAYFTYSKSPEFTGLMVDTYMLSIYFTYPATVIFILVITETPRVQLYKLALYTCSLVFSILHILGYVIEGYYIDNYQIVTIPGSLNSVYKMFAVSCAASTIIIASLKLKTTTSEVIRARSKSALIGLTPCSLIVIGIFAAKALGIVTSSSVIWPFATTFFIFVMLLETNNSILTFKLRWKLFQHATKRNVSTQDIIRLATELTQSTESTIKTLAVLEEIRLATTDQVPLAERMVMTEEAVIRAALKKTDGHQGEAAKLLGIKQPAVSKKAKKYKIYSQPPNNIT